MLLHQGINLRKLSTATVAANRTDSTKFQRMPALCVLSATSVLCLYHQQASGALTGFDGEGIRVAQRTLTVNASNVINAVGASSVFEEPALWASSKGLVGSLHLIKIPSGAHAGRVICVYAVNEAVSGLAADLGRAVYRRYSDDDGATWSSSVKIIDRAAIAGTITDMLPGSNGDFIQIPTGTYAGRLIFPFYGNGDGATNYWQRTAYSDDGGDTWAWGGKVHTALLTESTLCSVGTDTLLMTARINSGTQRFRSISTDGGATWSAWAAISGFTTVDCNASTLSLGDGSEVFLSCPNSNGQERRAFWIRRSRNSGLTFPAAWALYPGDQFIGYSSLKLFKTGVLILAVETGPVTFDNNNESIMAYTIAIDAL